MLSVLALVAILAARGAVPTDMPSASPSPVSIPFTTVTPAPLPDALVKPAPTPVVAPTPLYSAFESVTLGDSPTAVRKTLGKPYEIDPINVGEMWRYTIDGGNARLSVIFASGAALSVTVRAHDGKKPTLADPYGVVLGMSVDQLTSIRGEPLTVSDSGNRAYGDLAAVRWVYGFDGGQLTDINVSRPVLSATAPSALNLTDGRDGTSSEHAIVITASSAAAGTELETRYTAGLTCGQGGAWTVVTRTTIAIGNKWIDELLLSCSTDKTAQNLFFDVTSYAGK